MSDDQKQEHLEFAKRLALEAGEIMRKYFKDVDREWKLDKTPLTVADTEINTLVIAKVAETFPEHGVLGEEESTALGREFTWVCDPIDGTMPYSHGLPIATFSLALTQDGKSIVGVVYDPFMERMFTATLGGGAYCNDEAISVNSNKFENALIDAEAFPCLSPIVDRGVDFLQQLMDNGANVTKMWTVILPAVLVASGRYEAAMLNLNTSYDAAAVKVIVEEAGGKVTDLFGNDQRYDQPTKGFIASNGVIHDEIVKYLNLREM